MLRSAVISVILLGAMRAEADPTAAELNQAKVLFDRGRELVKQGDHARACPLFEESQRIVAALGTELNLAQCWVQTNKLLAARVLFSGVVERATAAKQQARVDLANQGLAELDAKMPRIQIVIRGTAVKVTVGDREVDASKPVEVDPGTHRVVAVDGGGTRTEAKADAKLGEVTTVTLDLARPVTLPPPPPIETATGPRTRRALVLGLAGTGAASLIVGLTAGELARRRAKVADDCLVVGDLARCSPEDADRLRSARSAGNLATIGVVLAIGLGVGAAAVHLTAPRRMVRPTVSARGAGLVIEGRW